MSDNVNETPNNDGLNSDEFSSFIGKFNDYFNNGDERAEINVNADVTFLDDEEIPTDRMIIELFITKEDLVNPLNINDYELDELGIPNITKRFEGTEWGVSKMIWNVPEGRVISFDIDQLSPTLDVKHIVVEDAVVIPFSEQLTSALESEDFIEAARIRDWAKEYKTLYVASKVKMDQALYNDDFEMFNEILIKLQKFKNKL